MKKLSLLFGLFILAVMLCGPANTSLQPERRETKTESQPQAPVIARVEFTREPTSKKLSDSKIEFLVPPCEVPLKETPEITPAETTQHSEASTTRPEPTAEAKPSEPPVKETAPAALQSGSGLPGFDYVPYLGPNVVIYAEDMYENGNKIGIMGDINKQVGIMD